MNKFILCAAVVAGIGAAQAAFEINPVFASKMVLQRGKPIPVWGTGVPGAQVTVEFACQSASGRVGTNGEWTVTLIKMPPCAEPHDLVATQAAAGMTNEVRRLTDVLVGDNWICAGQSNMEFAFYYWPFAMKESSRFCRSTKILRRVKPLVRKSATPYTVPKFGAQWDYPVGNVWFSSTCVGLHFAQAVIEATDSKIPIGLIECNQGGSNLEPFLDFEQKWVGPYREGIRETKETLFNAILAPYRRFPVKGVLWYQGCSNTHNRENYQYMLENIVHGWRQSWGEDVPFYWVQLAAYENERIDELPAGGFGSAGVREGQRRALRMPRTGMAVVFDLGDPKEIHPKEKLHVGERLAQWALKFDYGKDVVPSGPLYKSMKVEGDRIRLSFDWVGGGLVAGFKNNYDILPTAIRPNEKLRGFAIAGEDQKWHFAQAKIDGDTVVVSSKDVPNPVAVRYAYRASPLGANLYNRAGLPASPFKTDDWPLKK